jgi:hypothetical protein
MRNSLRATKHVLQTAFSSAASLVVTSPVLYFNPVPRQRHRFLVARSFLAWHWEAGLQPVRELRMVSSVPDIAITSLDRDISHKLDRAGYPLQPSFVTCTAAHPRNRYSGDCVSVETSAVVGSVNWKVSR